MQVKLLKSYKGFTIEKSWETNIDGTIKRNSLIYTAYDSIGDLFDACTTLAKLKEKIDMYIKA